MRHKRKYILQPKILVITGIAFILFLFTSEISLPKESSFSTGQDKEIEISVDASKKAGPLPDIFRTGVFIAHAPEFPPDTPIGRRFWNDQKPGAIEIQKPFLSPQLFPPGSTLEGYTQRLSESDTMKWAKEIHKNRGEVIFNLMGMPHYLRTIKHDSHSKPKDYEQWAKLVQATVDYVNNKLRINARYMVWDEPELFYGGAEEDYLTLYKYSVIGAKRADKNARIGGPASSAVNATFKGKKTPLIYKLIRFCGKTALPDMDLDKLPIDFIAWHHFDSMAAARLSKDVSLVQGWLKEYGYPADLTLIIGSWNSWLEFPNSGSKERDTEYLSAYILPALLAMDSAGIKRHTFFSLFEDWQIREGESIYGQQILKKNIDIRSEFFGGFGVVTKEYIIKPAYNAFKALSMLEGERLVTHSSDPFIAVLATQEADRTSVFFSNFIPDAKMTMRLAGNFLTDKGYRKDDIELYGVSKKKIEDIISGKISMDHVKVPMEVKKDLREAKALIEGSHKRQREDVSMKIKFDNLPFKGDVKYEHYLIDANHSNSFALKVKIEEA